MRSKSPKLKRSLIHISYQAIHVPGRLGVQTSELSVPVLEASRSDIDKALDHLFNDTLLDNALDLVLSDPLVLKGQIVQPAGQTALKANSPDKAKQFLDWKFEQELGLTPNSFEYKVRQPKASVASFFNLFGSASGASNQTDSLGNRLQLEAISKNLYDSLIAGLGKHKRLIASCRSTSDFARAFLPKAAISRAGKPGAGKRTSSPTTNLLLLGDSFVLNPFEQNAASFWRAAEQEDYHADEVTLDLIADICTHDTKLQPKLQIFGFNEQAFVTQLEQGYGFQCDYQDLPALGLFASKIRANEIKVSTSDLSKQDEPQAPRKARRLFANA